jgi:hypothetical protein
MNIIVNDCNTCPLCRELELQVGFICKAEIDLDKIIEQDMLFLPIHPTWCPLKKENITIVFDSKD